MRWTIGQRLYCGFGLLLVSQGILAYGALSSNGGVGTGLAVVLAVAASGAAECGCTGSRAYGDHPHGST